MNEHTQQSSRYSDVERETWDSLDHISMPLLRNFADHWNRLRGERRAPSRSDLDPAQLKPFLPHLFLLDVVRPAMRFRGRLVGTQIASSLGFDYTGRFLDEVISDSYYSTLREDLVDVAENAVLHYRITDMAWNKRPYARYHRLYAPLFTSGQRVDIVAGMACIVRQGDATAATEPLSAAIDSTVLRHSRIVLTG